jgi:hypothetical protein
MTQISIPASERSPNIEFDFGTNSFAIRGESYPEDVNAFYGPLMERFEAHLNDLQDATVSFTFELIYFNSSTAKILIGLFETLDQAAENGNDVSVAWLFEADDDNMEEMGQEFGEDLVHAKFELKKIEG